MTLALVESLMRNRSFKFKALIVDDDALVRQSLSAILSLYGWEVTEAESLGRAKIVFPTESWNIIYLDKILPDGTGLEFIEFVNTQKTNAKLIMITGQGSADEAMFTMSLGAHDYLTKPVSSDEILKHLQEYAENVASTQVGVRVPPLFVERGLVGRSPAMITVAKEIQRVASSDRRVLITGASGTGKEVVAREIYKKSQRAKKPFITVNCGAINKDLIESELFGHVKGSFTGAHSERVGLLQEAHTGTIFLDEITETPPDFQVKLLRVLQQGELRRVGSNRVVKIDVRVLAASNRDIEEEVRNGRFREDLFYRLNQTHIHLPPLRERTEDILPLVDYFVARQSLEEEHLISYAEFILEVLYQYDWPGNVRELENAIVQAVQVCDGYVVHASDLPRRIRKQVLKKMETGDPILIGQTEDLPTLKEHQERYIDYVIKLRGGITEAAKTLDVARRTLERRQSALERRSAEIDRGINEFREQLIGSQELDFFDEERIDERGAA